MKKKYWEGAQFKTEWPTNISLESEKAKYFAQWLTYNRLTKEQSFFVTFYFGFLLTGCCNG